MEPHGQVRGLLRRLINKKAQSTKAKKQVGYPLKPAKESRWIEIIAEEKSEKYDLKERTAAFGENVIEFAKTFPKHSINLPLINQLDPAAKRAGANYCEADNAESKKDFRHKIGICKKE